MESEGEDVPETHLNNSSDEVDYPPNNYVYRWIDLVFLTCGMTTFCLDLVSNNLMMKNYTCAFVKFLTEIPFVGARQVRELLISPNYIMPRVWSSIRHTEIVYLVPGKGCR